MKCDLKREMKGEIERDFVRRIPCKMTSANSGSRRFLFELLDAVGLVSMRSASPGLSSDQGRALEGVRLEYGPSLPTFLNA